MQDDRVATLWLNNADVRKAIHAEPVRYNFLIFTFNKKNRVGDSFVPKSYGTTGNCDRSLGAMHRQNRSGS